MAKQLHKAIADSLSLEEQHLWALFTEADADLDGEIDAKERDRPAGLRSATFSERCLRLGFWRSQAGLPVGSYNIGSGPCAVPMGTAILDRDVPCIRQACCLPWTRTRTRTACTPTARRSRSR